MEEIWKDVVGYEEMYKVSNLGNIYSVKRGKLLKSRNNHNGYLQVRLYINGKGKELKVHRIVAEAFISNYYDKPQVNHKDEDKTNNRVDNLEWVTNKENSNWGTSIERSSEKRSKRIKVIYQDDTYEIWGSANVFAREFGIDRRSVCNVLRGRQKTTHGMRFEYA